MIDSSNSESMITSVPTLSVKTTPFIGVTLTITYSITHDLDSLNVIPFVRNTNTNEGVAVVSWENASVNVLNITLALVDVINGHIYDCICLKYN